MVHDEKAAATSRQQYNPTWYASVVPLTTVVNLGVFINQSLTMTSHINMATGWCFRSLCPIRTIRRSPARDAARMLVSSLVMSWIDYCNCILASPPAHSIARLQSVLNTGGRVISDHITNVLRDDLHWLPVTQRIQFKLCLTVFKTLYKLAPTYISNMCVALTSARSGRYLRSAMMPNLMFYRQRLSSEKEFTVSGPSMWNTLPTSIRNAPAIGLFKTALKTHLFKIDYHLPN